MLSTPIELRQICWSDETLENIPTGFIPIDYRRNDRPDWRELWPIRNFLHQHSLHDEVMYGFLSPKFSYKTGLSYEQVQDFINTHRSREDLAFFSPFWDLSSFALNVFEQGEMFHPGLMETAQLFVKESGIDIDLTRAVTHSGNSIFCNYVVGNRRFWERWLDLADRLVAYAEEGAGSTYLRNLLNEDTCYGEQRLPRKIFVMERLPTLLLLVDPELTAAGYDCFRLPPSNTPLNRFFKEAVSCDALKRAHTASGSPAYLHTYRTLRNSIIH